jgi:alcohol dehydrogenase
MKHTDKALELLSEFKGEDYLFGPGVLSGVGKTAARAGRKAVLIHGTFPGSRRYIATILESLTGSGVKVSAEIPGARPNCPREDLFRITDAVKSASPELIVSFGGGSTIDAAKAAAVLHALGGGIDDYLGTGLVSAELERSGKALPPHVAIQTAASSGAHLTKYSNITDVASGQKKLIVDEAIVPAYPVFDYGVTLGAPPELTADGALDGIAHILEVLYSAVGKPYYEKLREVAEAGISLAVNSLPRVMENPGDSAQREALCLATDLGGYAIMLGGTNGGHLTSFSLVDVLSHGRACAMMNPYYTLFFAPAIEDPLRLVGKIYKEAGYIAANLDALTGRELGMAVAGGMFAFAERIGFPTRLEQVSGFSAAHIERALEAAKNPQLKMKLENMPVPLNADMIDTYMGPVLRAAASGDLSLIRNVAP